MGKIKGQSQYKKFKEGKPLTRKEAILAQCYVCNGEEEGIEDCQGVSCPLYDFSPHKSRRKGKTTLKSQSKPVEPERGSFMGFQGKEMADAGASVS